MSLSKSLALKLIKELKSANRELIAEVTRNNDLVTSIKNKHNLSEEEIDDGEFTNTFSSSSNVAYGYKFHDFDECGCDEHYCGDCHYCDFDEYAEPCSSCVGIVACSDKCYYDEGATNVTVKPYDDFAETRVNVYLECHKSEDCNHSISNCKSCKFRAIKQESVPCVGCNCINKESHICFHSENEN